MQHCLFQEVMQYKQDFTSAGCCNIALYRSLICKLRERKWDRRKPPWNKMCILWITSSNSVKLFLLDTGKLGRLTPSHLQEKKHHRVTTNKTSTNSIMQKWIAQYYCLIENVQWFGVFCFSRDFFKQCTEISGAMRHATHL